MRSGKLVVSGGGGEERESLDEKWRRCREVRSGRKE